MKVLGISCFYHDSAACLVEDGNILAAAQEERFTRIKHDPSFPSHSIRYCLESTNTKVSDITKVVYYEKPFRTFKRLIVTYSSVFPRGSWSFANAMSEWIPNKLRIKATICKEMKKISPLPDTSSLEIEFCEHHLSHASSAFFPSPFAESLILCMDGVGEWATTSAWIGSGSSIKLLWEIDFPHSLGLLYSAFTYFCGFKVNSGEYKLMGLAPYGEDKYSSLILDEIVSLTKDGKFKLNMAYFKYHRSSKMTTSKFSKLFDMHPRQRESELTQPYMDLAASIQVVTEKIVHHVASNLKSKYSISNLCLSGGVALNCVSNGKLLKSKLFDQIWIQPASGDAGSALGAALYSTYSSGQKRIIRLPDSMRGSLLGPKFSNNDIKHYLDLQDAKYTYYDEFLIYKVLANYIDDGKVIGWFNGHMEFGPRALGGRSIIGDPRNVQMQKNMNLKIKYRESFRPFAPSVMEKYAPNLFNIDSSSPYMLIVTDVSDNIKVDSSSDDKHCQVRGLDKLSVKRSTLQAITHVDFSARVQTVDQHTNPRYFKLIEAFNELTGCPCIINTSFNVRGEPIVCTPADAYRCFRRTEMDVLVLENYVMLKEDQPIQNDDESWLNEFELD